MVGSLRSSTGRISQVWWTICPRRFAELSKALATAIEWAGGEILLGRSGRDFRQTLPGKYASALQDVRLKLYVADSQQAGSARLHSRVGQIRAGLLGALSPLKIE